MLIRFKGNGDVCFLIYLFDKFWNGESSAENINTEFVVDHLDYYGRTDDKHKNEDKQADKEFDDKFHKFSLVVQILQEWKQPVKFTQKKKQMYEKNYFKRSLQTVFGLSVALHP